MKPDQKRYKLTIVVVLIESTEKSSELCAPSFSNGGVTLLADGSSLKSTDRFLYNESKNLQSAQFSFILEVNEI